MSDVAEMTAYGTLCQGCGVYIDEDDWPRADKLACGYPRWCHDCGGDPETNGATKRKGVPWVSE